jgi:hypothetical protein
VEKQFYQRIFMFIASLVIVTNIFCSTHQAYFFSSTKVSIEETVLDSKIGTYSLVSTTESIFDIEESRTELEEEENFSDGLKSILSTTNFHLSGAVWFYFSSGKSSEHFCCIKQKFPPIFLLVENFRI